MQRVDGAGEDPRMAMAYSRFLMLPLKILLSLNIKFGKKHQLLKKKKPLQKTEKPKASLKYK